MIDSLTAEIGGRENTLIINAGNNLADWGEIGKDIQKERPPFLFNVLESMGVDVIIPGERDTLLGLPYLRKLAETRSMKIICANLKTKQDSNTFFERAYIVEKSGRKILITSVLEPKLFPDIDAQYVITDPVDALKRVQKDIPHDVFIAVFYAPKKISKQWLMAVKGLDIAVSGDFGGTNFDNEVINGTKYVYNNSRGKSLAYVDLELTGPNGPARIKGPFVKELPVKKVKEDQKMLKDIHVFQKQVGRPYKKRSSSGAEPQYGKFYVGSSWCIKCHKEIVQAWEKTAHAKAIESLVAKGKQDDPECIKCHVTGFKKDVNNLNNYDGGFVALPMTPHMANVGCEACHGPADQHVKKSRRGFGRNVDAAKCMQCHNKERDPDFNFHQDKARGTH